MRERNREAAPSASGNKRYNVTSTRHPPELQGLCDGAAWGAVEPVDIGYFRPEGSDHRPATRCKLLYDAERLYGLFEVTDRYVRCVHAEFQGEVYKDSCVEFFVQPKADRGYFNFEFNCGGALRASYVTDPTRVGGSLKVFAPITREQGRLIDIFHSLPARIEPEINEATAWHLEFSIPLALLESFVGLLGQPTGQLWRANFFKCADDTSHPHWASWTPLAQRNFHAPESFGSLFFV